MSAASFGMPADRGDMGLYDPSFDKDSCGVGFVAELSAQPNRKIVSISTIRFLLCKLNCVNLTLQTDHRKIMLQVIGHVNGTDHVLNMLGSENGSVRA